MRAEHFLETRRESWDRLAKLVSEGQRRGVGKLTEAQLHDLTRLYPAVAVDVARARRYGLDPRTQQRLNALAIGAHGLLYRRRARRPLPALGRFFSREYPALFRRLWPYTTLATAIFLVAMLGTTAAVMMRPATAYVFVPRGLEMPANEDGISARDISERFRQMPNAPMAACITINNVYVAFNAFALGMLVGLGTCYVVLMNAMMLGAFIGHFVNHGLGYPLMSFLMPHGCLEIFAILVAAAAGLRLGLAIALPGERTRKTALRIGAREAVLLLLGTVPMFIVAGVIEGFVTPSYLPGSFKIAIGVMALGGTLAYLLSAGRRAAATDGLRP